MHLPIAELANFAVLIDQHAVLYAVLISQSCAEA